MSDPRKTAIIAALRAFVRQRPGLEFANYGDLASYRSESRRIQMDKRHAETLLSAVAENDGITADMIVKASESAFSGRLTISVSDVPDAQVSAARKRGAICKALPDTMRHMCVDVDYCAGQYFPTEYRKAVAAVCASALWYYVREHVWPGYAPDGSNASIGDWLRAYFRREYGRTIAARYFS